MMSDDLTVHILTEIRDAVLGTNERLDQTNQRLDQTNQRLDQTRTELRAEIAVTNQRIDQLGSDLRTEIGQTNQRIDQLGSDLRGTIGGVRDHVVQAELRLATRFVEMTAASRDVHELLIDRFDLRDRVERIEQDVAELKKRSS